MRWIQAFFIILSLQGCEVYDEAFLNKEVGEECSAGHECTEGLSCMEFSYYKNDTCQREGKSCSIFCGSDADCKILGESLHCYESCDGVSYCAYSR